jgi:hypothetical protein
VRLVWELRVLLLLALAAVTGLLLALHVRDRRRG